MTSAGVERRLAADERAGWSARLSVRERHRALVCAQWRGLLLMALAAVTVFGIAAAFATGPLQRGVILGGGLSTTGFMLVAVVVLASGTAPLLMGESAEQWTAQELRPLGPHGWKLINHFGLGRGDHDHVLVGPGGLLLVESKWGGTPWTLDDRDTLFQSAVSQVLRNARQLTLWHEVARHGHPKVEPVLVLWGPAGRNVPDGPPRRHASGVLVLSGHQLQQWALQRGRGVLDAAQVATIYDAMTRQVTRRDEVERTVRPMPRSVPDLAFLVLRCVLLAAVGVVAAANALTVLRSLPLWCLSGLALALVAQAVHHRTRWRWEARAFQLGVALTYVLGAVAVLGTYGRT